MSRRELKHTRAEAEVSIDFPSIADAEAMARALIPETTARGTRRASVRVTRRGKVTKMKFSAKDLVALRAMLNSFLRFASTWRRVSESMCNRCHRARAVRRVRCPIRK